MFCGFESPSQSTLQRATEMKRQGGINKLGSQTSLCNPMNLSQTDEKVLEIPVSMSELQQLYQRSGPLRKDIVSVSKFDQNGKVNYSSSEEEDSRMSGRSPT